MNYQPIANHGITGNMRTAALVNITGSSDWFCFPRFDSPSVFAAILDHDKGGRFEIAVTHEGVKAKQFYWPDTNILMTRFYAAGGIAEIEDFMPPGLSSDSAWRHSLIRRVRVTQGSMEFRLRCHPAFDYARAAHRAIITKEGASFHSAGLSLGLTTEVPLTADGHGVEAVFVLQEEQSAVFVLGGMQSDESCDRGPSMAEADELFDHTVNYWRRWLSKCTYAGHWRENVYRSALTLKLLTFEPTGAIS
ncbi:MAG: glycoside hydrolase family 15 protein, partial [Pirellulaceae bacterium]